jgi:CHAD domain-containing protein
MTCGGDAPTNRRFPAVPQIEGAYHCSCQSAGSPRSGERRAPLYAVEYAGGGMPACVRQPNPTERVSVPMPPSNHHRTHGVSVVRQRLQAVGDCMRRFRKSPGLPEALHDLRVACRRAEAALRLCRDLLSPQPVKWLRKQLRHLRQLSNTARDNEVLRMWLKEQRVSFVREFQSVLKSERDIQRVQIVEFIENLLRGDRFADRTQLACPAGDDRVRDRDQLLMAHRFLDDLFRFIQALPTRMTSPPELHLFRIASKRLRYAIECLCDIDPNAKFRSPQRILTQVQERLGELHDLDVRLSRLKLWGHQAGVSVQWQESAAQSQRLMKSWQAWWRSVAWQSAVGSAVTEILRLAVFSRAPRDASH